MAKNYTRIAGMSQKAPVSTPQTEKAVDVQVLNSAGGYVFQVSDWQRLDKFLVLGTESGTYYIDEKKLTTDNAKTIVGLIEQDGKKVVDRIVEISDSGRAPKNDPALFALALCASAKDIETRKYALQALPKVARIATHLFNFVTYEDGLRGWGKGLQKAIARWYNSKDIRSLAMQVCKYASRRVEGEMPWSHRDLLRKIHLVPANEEQGLIFRYAVKGREGFKDNEWAALKENKGLSLIWAHETAKTSTDPKEIVSLIKSYGLPHESIAPEVKNDKLIYDALVEKMPVEATIRNLGTMTRVGTLKPLGDKTRLVCDRITDLDTLKKGRIHPLKILGAMKTYASGQGFRGNNTWEPVQQITEALDDCFGLSFQTVEPTGKRFLLGVDVSGSMSSAIGAMPVLSCAEAAAALAMIIKRTEKQSHIFGFSDSFRDLKITAKDSLEDVLEKTTNQNFGGTDCALPMIYAQTNQIDVDCFVVITDSETWFGDIHPFQSLKNYRRARGINAKLIVLAMTASEFTIADPSDPGMLDVVGYDSSVLDIISEFAKM